MYVCGKPQLGKTRRIVAFLNELIISRKYKIAYYDFENLCGELSKEMTYGNVNLEQIKLLDESITDRDVDVVVFDNFNYCSTKLEVSQHIFNLIKNCINEKIPLIFVSNSTISELSNTYIKNNYTHKPIFEIFFTRLSNLISENNFINLGDIKPIKKMIEESKKNK